MGPRLWGPPPPAAGPRVARGVTGGVRGPPRSSCPCGRRRPGSGARGGRGAQRPGHGRRAARSSGPRRVGTGGAPGPSPRAWPDGRGARGRRGQGRAAASSVAAAGMVASARAGTGPSVCGRRLPGRRSREARTLAACYWAAAGAPPDARRVRPARVAVWQRPASEPPEPRGSHVPRRESPGLAAAPPVLPRHRPAPSRGPTIPARGTADLALPPDQRSGRPTPACSPPRCRCTPTPPAVAPCTALFPASNHLPSSGRGRWRRRVPMPSMHAVPRPGHSAHQAWGRRTGAARGRRTVAARVRGGRPGLRPRLVAATQPRAPPLRRPTPCGGRTAPSRLARRGPSRGGQLQGNLARPVVPAVRDGAEGKRRAALESSSSSRGDTGASSRPPDAGPGSAQGSSGRDPAEPRRTPRASRCVGRGAPLAPPART